MTTEGEKRKLIFDKTSRKQDILIKPLFIRRFKMAGYIYILFNKKNGTLYTGVTSDLVKRVYEHKSKAVDGFTKRYNVDKLGYYEVFEEIEEAIKREKNIKAGSRKKKIELIESINPDWSDLYDDIIK